MSRTPDSPPTLDYVSPPPRDAATLPPRPDGEPATLPPADISATLAQPASAAPAVPAVAGYEVLGELGRGGMGVVYKARQTALNRVVALKMVLVGGHAGPEALARFRSEAEAVARLQHPNIVQIYEVGESSGLPYFSLEFCPAGSLADKLDGTPLPPKQAAELVEKLAGAMHAAHQAGVVHRDLKPANVLLAADGSPKVTDFGLAKKLDAGDGPTRSGAIMGTPSYMAPEQASGEGKKVGPAADTYALGAILYELLTGRPPFKAATSLDTILQVIEQEPVSPSRLNAQAPRDLETVALKCLHKDPAKRYATAAALADDLRRWRAGEPIAARPAGRLERAAKWARRRPALAALLGVVVLTAVSGAAGSWAFVTRLRHERDIADFQRRLADERELAARQYLLAANTNLAQIAWDQGQVGRVLELLEELKPQPGQEDLRGFEWHYLDRLCHNELRTLKVQTGRVSGVAFSPDGTRLASGGDCVRVWDAATGRELLAVRGHAGRVYRVAFSPDGTRLASNGNDQVVRVWGAASGQELLALQGHAGRVNGVAFSPDGSRLASAGEDKTVRVWDAASGRELLALRGHAAEVHGVAFSPDGSRLASCDDETVVRLWDTATGGELLTLKGNTGQVLDVAFSPDGSRLASAGYGGVRVWETATGRELHTLRNPSGAEFITMVVYSPDGTRLASAGMDETVRVWDAVAGQELLALQGHTDEVLGLAFSPDGGRLASTSEDRTVRIWDAAAGRDVRSLQGGSGLAAHIKDGARPASPGQDPTVRVWDYGAGWDLLARWGHLKQGESVRRVTVSPNGARLTGAGDDGPVRVWDAATGRELFTLKGHAGEVLGMAFSRDGSRLASTGEDKTVRVWDATGRELLVLRGHTDRVFGVAFSRDGARLASAGGDKVVRVWDAATGRELLTLKGHTGGVGSVAFSPDGSRLASSGDYVRVWDATTGRELLALKGAGNKVAFSADGTRLSSTHTRFRGFKTVEMARVWDARPLTETLRNELEARSRLEFLFDRPLLKDEVRDFLQTDKTISDPVRQIAQKFLDLYESDPDRLNEASRTVVRQPGADAAKVRRAVQLAEVACQLQPDDGLYLNSFGIAQYRAGQYPQALDTLTRSRPVNAESPRFGAPFGDQPADIAFLAMCHEQLGQPEPARKLLAELRELCQKPAWAKNEEAQAFLREVVALIEGG